MVWRYWRTVKNTNQKLKEGENSDGVDGDKLMMLLILLQTI